PEARTKSAPMPAYARPTWATRHTHEPRRRPALHRKPARPLWQEPCPARSGSAGAVQRSRQPGGPQRRGTLHHPESHHGFGSTEFRPRKAARPRPGRRPPYTICRAGIAYVPEEREVFANLTVEENLRMGEQPAVSGAPRWAAEQMYDYFPRLKERRNTKAGSLSGGEQQMLTICRSLLGNPLVMLIDEPTEGLAPRVVAQVGECIRDMHRKGVSVVLVEQKLTIALRVSTRVCVMGH